MILICWKTCYKFCWRLAFISLHSETCLSYESYVCHICFICFSYVQEGNYSGFCEALAVGGCQDAAISVTLAQPQDGHGSFVAGCRPGCPWWLWGMLWQCPTLPSLSQSSLTYLQNINHYIHYLYIYIDVKQTDYVFGFTIFDPSPSHLFLQEPDCPLIGVSKAARFCWRGNLLSRMSK
jgi:hypothetical protein